MSSTPQRMRPQRSLIGGGTWSTIFPTNFQTEQGSCQFIKQAVHIALSSVTYLSGVLGEECFEDRNLDGINLKILDGNSPVAKAFKKNLEGINEAIEKKYLKEVFLIFYEDERKQNILQHYCFNISYNVGVGSIQSSAFSKDGVMFQNRVYTSTKEMMMGLFEYARSFGESVSDAFISTRLTYYDNTPDDYEPGCYTPCQSFPDVLNSGQYLQGITTQHHSMKVRVHSSAQENSETVVLESFENEDDHGIEKRKMVSVKAKDERLLASQSQIFTEERGKVSRADDFKSLQAEFEKGPEKEKVNNTCLSQTIYQVNCICGINVAVGPMVVCCICEDRSHAACYQLYDPTNLPSQNACLKCYNDSFPCFHPDKAAKIGKQGLDENKIKKHQFRILLIDLMLCGELRPEITSCFKSSDNDVIMEFLTTERIIIKSEGQVFLDTVNLTEYMKNQRKKEYQLVMRYNELSNSTTEMAEMILSQEATVQTANTASLLEVSQGRSDHGSVAKTSKKKNAPGQKLAKRKGTGAGPQAKRGRGKGKEAGDAGQAL